MIDLKRIFPECCADTLFVELIFKRGRPAHYKGITKVATALKDFRNDTLFVVGLIDEDKFKQIPPYISKFEVIQPLDDIGNFVVLKVKGTEKHLIKIAPEFEKWVFNVAKSCGVDTTKHGFNTWQDLKDVTKTEDVFSHKEFRKFLNEVIDKNPPAIQTLRFWLSKAL